METINRVQSAVLLERSKGKIFSVEFIKKDGTYRKMLARTNVKKYLKGGETRYCFLDKGLISCFDLQKKNYRTINLNTVTRLNINGKKYEVIM